MHKSQTKVETLFAEQELVDCDTNSDGCSGGLMDYAFTYLKTNSFCTEDQYPYIASEGTCKADTLCTGGPVDKSFTDFTAADEDAVLNALADGPVSVAVDATVWSFYKHGIVTSCYKDLNHGVTLVGYNSEEGSVTIRNSWGSSWGESGLIRLKSGQDTCGYADKASVPTF